MRPRRRDEADRDAVLLGKQPELVGLLDLHVPQPQPQNSQKPELERAKQHCPPPCLAVELLLLLALAPHSGRPIRSVSPVAGLRNPARRSAATTAG